MATTNKRKKAVAATVAAAALLLGGTFAWTSISQQATNEAIVDINPGGRLHDDFNGKNKDVYVENFGDEKTGVNIFARVKLTEYVELGPDAGNKNIADDERNVAAVGGQKMLDDGWDKATDWQTYIPGAGDNFKNADNVSNAYWTLDWGEEDDEKLPVYMPTFNKNKDSLAPDVNGTYEGTIDDDIVHYDNYVTYEAGESLTNRAAYDWDSDQIEEDGDNIPYDNVANGTGVYEWNEGDAEPPIDDYDVLTKEEEHIAAPISTTASVVSMDQWIENGSQLGAFWVYDSDGWAYWAQPIAPGTTTGLFLNGVNMTKTPDENWYYGINVVAEFATWADIDKFENTTSNADGLLKLLVGSQAGDGDFVAKAGTLTGNGIEIYVDNEYMSVDGDTNTLTVVNDAGWRPADVTVYFDGFDDVEYIDTVTAAYEWNGGEWVDHGTSIVDHAFYKAQGENKLDLYCSEESDGRYKLTATYTDADDNEHVAEIEFNIVSVGGTAGGEEEEPYGFGHMLLAYDDQASQSETFHSKGYLTPGDQVKYSAVAYYNNGETIEITSENMSWNVSTVEGELHEGTTVTQDGLLTVSEEQADLSVVSIEAVFTDKDGVGHTEEQAILVSKEDVYLTLKVKEEAPYYTEEYYTAEATAVNTSGESVPMEWQYDLVPATSGEEIYGYTVDDVFWADDAGDYMLKAWPAYILGHPTEVPITILQNPNTDDSWDPEPTFSLWIEADPAGYIPGLSDNNITLTAYPSFGDDVLETTGVTWRLDAHSDEETTLTDNGDGTASLFIGADEDMSLVIYADYEYDGKVHTAECVIPNHPYIGSMDILDDATGSHDRITYNPEDGATINLTAYAFPEYTGTTQPIENAYTGKAAETIAEHLSFYLVRDYLSNSQESIEIDGVTLEQDGAHLTITIDRGVNEDFDVVCYVDSGMLLSISVGTVQENS